MKTRLYSLLTVGLAVAMTFVLSACVPDAQAADAVAMATAIEAVTAAPDIATISGTEINVKDPAAQLVGFLLVAIGALLKWGADKLFGVKGKVPLTDDMRKLLEQAIDAALELSRRKLQVGIADMTNPTIQNQTVAAALNFVLAAVPTVIDALGYDEDKLENLIHAKLFDDPQAASA